MIYFIGNEHGQVKIGYAKKSVYDRRDDLQTASPDVLQVLLVLEGDMSREHELHEKFKADRIRGEWFQLSQALRTYIGRYRSKDVRNRDYERVDPTDLPELAQYVDRLVGEFSLKREKAEQFLAYFFDEIREAMLRGEDVDIRGLGKFYISSPETTLNDKRVFPKFQPRQSLFEVCNC